MADDPSTVFLVAMWVARAPAWNRCRAGARRAGRRVGARPGRRARLPLGRGRKRSRRRDCTRSAASWRPTIHRFSRTSRGPTIASTFTSSDDGALARPRERLPRGRGARSTPSGCAREVGDADGIVEVTAHGDDWADVVIWNPDGSIAEMSGNGTRIAARLARRRDDSRAASASREVVARAARRTGRSSRTWATVEVVRPEKVAGLERDPGRRSETRTRSSWAIPTSCRGSGRCSRRMRASRSGRTSRSRASTARPGDGARVGARRGGDERVGHERGRRRGRDARRRRGRRLTSPAATCTRRRSASSGRPNGALSLTAARRETALEAGPEGASALQRADAVFAERVVELVRRSVDSLALGR